jgi:hypothetical protein
MRKLKALLISIVLSLTEVVPQMAIQDAGKKEISGVIREISTNVHLLVVKVSEEKTVSSETERSVSVEPETKITLNGKNATLSDLKEGQVVKVRFQGDSSKAVSIEVVS